MRARPGLGEPSVGNHPGPPDLTRARMLILARYHASKGRSKSLGRPTAFPGPLPSTVSSSVAECCEAKLRALPLFRALQVMFGEGKAVYLETSQGSLVEPPKIQDQNGEL